MDSHIIEVNVADVRQLFNSLDPSPFREKDLDRDAEEYIVAWADEASPRSALELVIRLPNDKISPVLADELPKAVQNYFAYRATISRRRIHAQLREGRTALVIGLLFLFTCMILRELAGTIAPSAPRQILQEGLVILGWVAMWGPLQILLYDWWPVRRHAKLCRRLSEMPVRIVPIAAGAPTGSRNTVAETQQH